MLIRHKIILQWLACPTTKSQRFFSSYSPILCNQYHYTWRNPRRLQNPNMVRNMPTYEFVREDGKLKKAKLIYICGFGSTGALGLPKYYNPEADGPSKLKRKEVATSTFRRLKAFSSSGKIRDIACGYGFTLVAAEPEGSDAGYPLEIVATPSPIPVPTKTPIMKVACGRSHSLLLNKTGRVFSLGNNSLGQCARPVQEEEIYFGSRVINEIKDLPSNISEIECGQDHSLFLTDDGRLYSCGWGADGQTGLGHYETEWRPTQVKGDIEGQKIIKVSSYADTALALDNEGNVFGWGNTEYAQFRVLANNESEQFNLPKYLKIRNVPGKIVDVAAGGTICALLNDRGQVFVWGFGILGKGPNVDQSSHPTLIPETLFGMNVYNPDTKVEKIYASLSHFAAISNQGDLYAWGKNRSSALGFAHSQDQYFPMRVNMNLAQVKKVALGVDHSCAIAEKVC